MAGVAHQGDAAGRYGDRDVGEDFFGADINEVGVSDDQIGRFGAAGDGRQLAAEYFLLSYTLPSCTWILYGNSLLHFPLFDHTLKVMVSAIIHGRRNFCRSAPA